MNNLTGNDISLPGAMFAVVDTDHNGTVGADRANGQVLALLEGFYEDIKFARKAVGYKIGHPSHDWFRNPGITKYAESFIEKYRLDYRWLMPLKTLMIMDYLTLPSAAVDVTITNPHPDNKPGGPFSFTVSVSRGMSLHQLASQIVTNGQWVEEYLAALPTGAEVRLQENAMHWGSALWLMRQFHDPNMTARDFRETLVDPDVPDAATLNVYYQRFVRALNTHTPEV